MIGSSGKSVGSGGWVEETGEVGSADVLRDAGTVTTVCALESLTTLLRFATGPVSRFGRGTLRTGSTKAVLPLAPFQGSR